MRISLIIILLLGYIGVAQSAEIKVDSLSATTRSNDTTIDFIWNPPGQLISVGKHRLHIHCVGKGPVTVIFEAGLGGSSLEWRVAQQSISTRARACVYDRGGYGWSDPAGGRRDSHLLAAETNLLLNNINVRGPLILIGHSFGGFVIRELANLRLCQSQTCLAVEALSYRRLAYRMDWIRTPPFRSGLLGECARPITRSMPK